MRTLHLLLFLPGLAAQPARGTIDCSVALPVYDAFGQRLGFKVESVGPRGAGLARMSGTYRVGKDRESVEFSSEWLDSDGFVVKLRGPSSKSVDVEVPLGVCRYRQSTVIGENDSGADTGYSVGAGKISGCALQGDWWVRAVPMFGGGRFVGGFEGYVDRLTGEYSIAASFSGQRHLLVLGHGKEPVRTVSVNLRVGGENRLPPIVLTADCR